MSVSRAFQHVAKQGRSFLQRPSMLRAVTIAPMASVSSLNLPPRPFHVSRRGFANPSAPHLDASGEIEFNLADIGEGIAEVEVINWFVKEGDVVAAFDKLCTVQSDKATVEITSRYEGSVVKLHYAPGDIAHVGKSLVRLKPKGDSLRILRESMSSAPASSSASSSVSASASSSSASSSSAPSCGKIAGDVLRTVEQIQAAPAVRKIAMDNKIDLTRVPATGPNGRLLKEDVLEYIRVGGKAAPPAAAAAASKAPVAAAAPATPAAAAAPVVKSAALTYSREDRVVPVTGIARIMVQSMVAANAVPHMGYSDEIVMDELYLLREQTKNAAQKDGVKLTFLPFILKATSLALLQYPQLNSHVSPDCTSVTWKGSHNISLAMDTPRGLLVPNIKNVQDLSVMDIARELTRLSDLGSRNMLGTEDLVGGTFSLSNIGSVGGTYMRPVLVVPQTVIGALGKFQLLPRYDEKMNIKPTRVMAVSFSADHRVVDGATLARFSNAFKNYLENPYNMILNTK